MAGKKRHRYVNKFYIFLCIELKLMHKVIIKYSPYILFYQLFLQTELFDTNKLMR